MSKRNLILLIIVLVIAGISILGFLYSQQQPTNGTGDNTPGTNFFSQFNPFSSGTKNTTPPTTTPPVDVSGNEPTKPTTEEIAKLKKVSSMPIAGFTVFSQERLKVVPVVITPDSTTTTPAPTTPSTSSGQATKKTTTKTAKVVLPPTEFAPALRYVSRDAGNIYETFADNITEKQFTGTVIPKVYDAFFGNNGLSVVMRYLKADGKTIETFFGTMPKEVLGANTTTPATLKGSLLPDNIKDISVSGDAVSLFYLFTSGNDLIGTTLNLATGKKVQIFDSPFTEWLSWWPNSKIITFTTKPSSTVPGYMYSMNPANTKAFNPVLSNINGLTTETSPNGKLVLYADSNLTLSIYHTDTNVSNLVGVKTLPEKCAWGSASDVVYCAVPKSIPSNQYPDAWYQGEVSFGDQLWKVDIKTGNATLLVDPASVSGGQEVDGIKLALDPGANFLFFVNKKDSYLWEFNLK